MRANTIDAYRSNALSHSHLNRRSAWEGGVDEEEEGEEEDEEEEEYLRIEIVMMTANAL